LLVVGVGLNREGIKRKSTVQAPLGICCLFEKCADTVFETMNVLPSEPILLKGV